MYVTDVQIKVALRCGLHVIAQESTTNWIIIALLFFGVVTTWYQYQASV